MLPAGSKRGAMLAQAVLELAQAWAFKIFIASLANPSALCGKSF
jgi:hypothetical protein